MLLKDVFTGSIHVHLNSTHGAISELHAPSYCCWCGGDQGERGNHGKHRLLSSYRCMFHQRYVFPCNQQFVLDF